MVGFAFGRATLAAPWRVEREMGCPGHQLVYHFIDWGRAGVERKSGRLHGGGAAQTELRGSEEEQRV